MSKETLKILFEHELSICKKLKEEHFDAWSEAMERGDKVGAECEMEMVYNFAGQVLAWGEAIEYIDKERSTK